MHKFLKSIGFSKYNTVMKIRELRQDVMENASRKEVYPLNEEESFFCYEKDYGECFGLCLIKVGVSEEDSDIDSFFPYVKGFNYLFNDKIEVDACSDREGYYGICDDNNIGIPMIFFVNNPLEYRMRKIFHGEEDLNCVTLSGLGDQACVLLPIEKDEDQKKFERKRNELRNDMINEAKAGNLEAMEQLTLEDMATFTKANIRSKHIDIFTIVSSYFMPHTVECDKYSVLAEIVDVAELKNKKTGEELYYLSLNCNSIEFEVLINKKNMLGIPMKGRRFKGHVWMQGQMDAV